MTAPPMSSSRDIVASHVGSGPIRVRAVYTRYPHCGAHSGFRQLLTFLDPRLCRVDAYAASDGDDDLPLPFAALREQVRRRIRRRGMEWYKLSDLAAELRALPGCLTQRTDVVHFLDAEHSAQYLPRWVRRWSSTRTKVVATFHQMPEMLERLVSRDVVATIDRITVVSPAQLPFFSGFVPRERVQVLLLGVDTDFFRPGETPHDSRAFTTITTGHWLRDWSAMRAVAMRLAAEPGLVFHVVTDRPTGLDDLPNVVIHRRVDDATLLSLYQAADCLLLPLVDATANNSLVEGIACGLPVVSTDLTSVRAYVSGDEAILVEGNGADRIADALLHLRRHPDLRTRMGAAARRRAVELSWPRVARDYERLYAGVAGRRR
jgi:glycosyltransferase involved in cell wall biosynthesis